MIIKKSRKREWFRFLVRVGLLISLIIVGFFIFDVDRIVGDGKSPNYKDGDLVFRSNFGRKLPFLLIRVRGFND